ncbi:hypothetical protein VPNG_02836 [Cytospora leucostoma]|uniref:Uncharacterized protein n=1 Tax=Cytospora leucostoma TaxID=1230097 RepID=A0A423XKI1_9PEZI|nr:hypothetical protein VPNG_02836 [Cytospora leucostoma]
MKLTPIRVRGKRGQPKPVKRTRVQESEDGAEPNGGQQPERKRARKHHGRSDDDTRVRRARLQQLPHEILERIFIASHNLCLPLASRELYHMLSSDSIKYRLVGAAFGPTWDAYYGCDNFEVMSYDGWQSDAERVEGDPTFQSAILACSWAKLPMLLTSFDVWIRQQSKGRVYFRIPELKQDRLQMFSQTGSLYEKAYIDAEPVNNTNSSSTMTMREKLAFDHSNFEALISYTGADEPAHIPLRGMTYHLRAILGMHLEVHPGAKIPMDLLSGPFESEDGVIDMGTEKMHRLFWLVRGGACLQEDQTWEVTRNGFKQILQLELAARLLTLFDLLGVFDTQLHWPRYIVQTSLAQVSALIPRAGPSSRREALLGGVAALLRQALGQQYEGTAAVRNLHVGAFARVWRYRAGLFLGGFGAGEGGQLLPASPALVAGAVGNGGPVMHEPWSDFGLD